VDLSTDQYSSRFLVTFSNQAAYSGRPLVALVDVETDECQFVADLLDNDEVLASRGAAGICRTPTGYALLLQGYPARICYLRPDLSLERVKRLSKVEDSHSIIWTGHSLLAVSTETNAIVEIGEDDSETIIHYEGPKNSKSTHLNGIALDAAGNIIISGFGQPEGSGQAARNGFLRNIATGETLVGNLREPHSVLYYNGVLYTLESQTGNLVRSRNGGTISSFRKFYCYARGLAITPRYTIVGQSARRLVSRKSARADAVATAVQARDSQAGLHILTPGDLNFVPIGAFAEEIYDVIPFPAPESSETLSVIAPAEHSDAGGKGAQSAAGLLNAAWVAANRGDLNEAIEKASRSAELKPHAIAPLMALGSYHLRVANFQDAATVLRRILEKHPSHPEALDLLSEAMVGTKDHKQAISHCQQAVSQAPRYKQVRHRAAERLARINEPKLAETLLRDTLNIDPDGDTTHRMLAGALYRQGKKEEALEHALKAVTARTEEAPYHEFVGILYTELGKPAEAEPFLRDAVDLNPDAVEAWRLLFRIMLTRGDVAGMLAEAKRAHLNLWHNDDFTVMVGDVLMNTGRKNEAVAWFEDGIQKKPEADRLYHGLSRAFSRQGEPSSAIKAAKEACRIAPRSPENKHLLGIMHEENGELVSAERSFREAITLNPALPDVHFSLSQVLGRQGRKTAALEAGREACRLAPKNAAWEKHVKALEEESMQRA
jgi:tetratricopeptide (TPR) repeat protein